MKASTILLVAAAGVAAYFLLGMRGAAGTVPTIRQTGPAGNAGNSLGVAAIQAGGEIVGQLVGWLTHVGDDGGGDVISDPTYDLDV